MVDRAAEKINRDGIAGENHIEVVAVVRTEPKCRLITLGNPCQPPVGTLWDPVREERVVAPDNTVASNGRRLQIPNQPARAHFAPATVRVHHYPDGELAIFHGPRPLARWPADDPAVDPIIDAAASPAFAPALACGRRGQALLCHPAHSAKTEPKAVNLRAT